MFEILLFEYFHFFAYVSSDPVCVYICDMFYSSDMYAWVTINRTCLQQDLLNYDSNFYGGSR